MRASRSLPLFAAAVIAVGCAAVGSESASEYTAADSTAVRASADKWVSSMLAKDFQAWATTVTPGVIMHPPNSKPISGRDAATEYVRNYPPISKFEIQVDEQWGHADVAFDRGRFTLTATLPNGAVVNDTGTFFSVFRRQPDSTWAHDRVMWNSSLPLPAAPAAPATRRR